MALQRQLKRFPAVLLPARLMDLLPASGFRIRSGNLPVRTGAIEIVNVYERSGFKIRRLLLVPKQPGAFIRQLPSHDHRHSIFYNYSSLISRSDFRPSCGIKPVGDTTSQIANDDNSDFCLPEVRLGP